MNVITVLTSPTCSYCHAAKNLLKNQGIDYKEFDLLKDGDLAQQLLIKSGQRTVPQIFINEKPIGGFTELSQLVANNKLDLTQVTLA
ncbi:MAG: glutaredoxin [Methylococcaceae bacterium]|nr:glutaredoxin [Methylococcaceae bacterium]